MPSKKKKTIKRSSEKPFFYHLGNLIIAITLFSSFLIFYPIINVYLPQKIENVENLKGDYITIPKINAQAPLVFNVDPYNQKVYNEALKKGVAHAKGTSLPGEKGSFVFAHSSGNPIDLTSYNIVFFRLGELKKGDEIVIKTEKDGVKKYEVEDTKIVWPTDVKYLKPTSDLTIMTCFPIGTSLQRLLVFARLTN